MSAEITLLVEALEHQRILISLEVLSITLYLYEVIINLPLEIEHIWMRKWSLVTFVYILQRYLPFLDTVGLILHRSFGTNLSTQTCDLNYKIIGWCFCVGIVLSESALILRVWVVWRRNVIVAIGLIIFSLACWVPSFVYSGQFLNTLKFSTAPFPNFKGCFITGGSSIEFVPWTFLMVYDTGIFIMISIPGVSAYKRGGRSELIKTIYQDGVIYYALLFMTSIGNVAVTLTLPQDLFLCLIPFERVLHSIMTSRAILHIRQIALQHYTTQHMSTMQFTGRNECGDDSTSNEVEVNSEP